MGKKEFVNSHLHDKELIQKLWQAFRIGQTTYIAYAIGLINFTLILYRLAGIDKYIEPLPFALILIAIMLPAGIIVGYLHIKKQLPTETKIMAHNNPYVYKAVPDSKETMGIKTQLWNFDQIKVANHYIEFHADMDKKLWLAMNELTGREVFTKEDIEHLGKIKDHAKTIQEGVDDWKPKYQQLFEGKKVSEIQNAEETIELEKNNDK